MPVSFQSSEEDAEWDTDDKPESEENQDDVILDKFKVLDTDPDERQNTPETKASRDAEESEKMKLEMQAKAEED